MAAAGGGSQLLTYPLWRLRRAWARPSAPVRGRALACLAAAVGLWLAAGRRLSAMLGGISLMTLN